MERAETGLLIFGEAGLELGGQSDFSLVRTAQVFFPWPFATHSTPIEEFWDRHIFLQAVAYGTDEYLSRPCVDCGLYAGCFCDGLLDQGM